MEPREAVERKTVVYGGDVASGMTSNIELDLILNRHLRGVLPCDTLPNLSHERAASIKRRVLHGAIRYFPLFVRHHWIAAIFTATGDALTLHVLDSAPTPAVHHEVRSIFKRRWPDLPLQFHDGPRQRPYSDDCGIYMMLHFFADFLEVPFTRALHDSAAFRSALSRLPEDTHEAHKIIIKLLELSEKSHLLGGASPSTNVPEDDTFIRALHEEAQRKETAAAKRAMCYMLVATALECAARRRKRSMNVGALVERARRLPGFRYTPGAHHDAGDALAAMGLTIIPYAPAEPGAASHPQLLIPPQGASIIVQSAPGAGLPAVLGDYRFVIGAQFRGEVGPHGATQGHYVTTLRSEDSVLGTYSRHEATTARNAQPDRDSDEDELTRVQQTVPTPLNCAGRSAGGALSPRDWFIYDKKPPHLQQAAWNRIGEATRKQEIRWLHELRSMPTHLLRLDLPQAVLELVRDMAASRRWKASTHAHNLAVVSQALRRLPLYTNMREPIDLNTSPEWREALACHQRLNRETPPQQALPITLDQVEATSQRLASAPQARLMLWMMWMFAARASDIRSLRAQDVQFDPGTGKVALTIRYGKGARLSSKGTYALASSLPEVARPILRDLLRKRRGRSHLFRDIIPTSTVLKAALRETHPELTLPSLRRGAAIHMAFNGVTFAEIMKLTGHVQVNTLRRYLGYGRQLTTEDEIARENASRALLPRQ